MELLIIPFHFSWIYFLFIIKNIPVRSLLFIV
ncbi:hypothetical protein NC652_027134 [Populus alba x Populus x berolinensis]|uniref:Uncharacterized protein n=1 Tax=Populus alba x Populus x berolinensis TaxID=444605 RepID=A0AAD6M3X2_9ROSI|nr:hypothetical protein NC652_027134 [Populus alba x Populus x berolinensis]KAJ6978513.1 hypothetical protein NC653_026817 [Populus alba x Populus x berolinensis]